MAFADEITLADFISMAPSMEWKREEGPDAPGRHSPARCYRGTGGGGSGWVIHVCDFDISEQGFQPGSRGHDGAAAHHAEGVIVRLGHEAGKVIWHIAAKIAEDGNGQVS